MRLVPFTRIAFTRQLALCALVISGGCERYHAEPLNGTRVDQRLKTPTTQSIQAGAATLKHPLITNISLEPELGLTPDQAAIVAVLNNPTLKAARDQRAFAGAALQQAGLLPNPQFSYNYDWITGGNTLGTVNAYGWGFSYDVTSLIAHDANIKSAKADFASINLNIAWQEWQTAEAAKIAVYDLTSLRAQLAVMKEIDSRLQENFALMRKAESLHLKTAIDLAAAEATSREAHMTLLQLQRDGEHQRLQLNRVLGLPGDTAVKLRNEGSLPEHFDLPGEAELIDEIEQRRLDLLALRKGYDSQEQTLRAAVLNQFPKINLGLNRASDNTNVHSLGLGMSIDLPLFDHNQAGIAKEKATRQRLFDEYVARVFDARADIAAALSDLRAINQQIAETQAALPNLQQLLKQYKDAVDHGRADVLSYYGAWNNAAQKNLDLIRLRQQLADNRIALELAAGRYFADKPASTHPTTQPLAIDFLTSSKS